MEPGAVGKRLSAQTLGDQIKGEVKRTEAEAEQTVSPNLGVVASESQAKRDFDLVM